MSKPGKRFREAAAKIDDQKLYGLEEAVKLVKGGAKAKFDETIEVAMNLGVDPRLGHETPCPSYLHRLGRGPFTLT